MDHPREDTVMLEKPRGSTIAFIAWVVVGFTLWFAIYVGPEIYERITTGY